MAQQESSLPNNLSAPAKRVLDGAGYPRLEQFAHVSEAELKKLHGIGPKSIRQLRQALVDVGLSFADGKKR